ncbi:unnamed protein product [Orchesella dallaii]|uniref:D-isomer specific 2-hydroxyacid dehydrogenase NAD-binding domain-containing protein n=1 Tax=Orchesella dallaii TaxID=48710 RepID=A0ABP1RKA0_9HEXA
MINDVTIQLMRPGVRFVNISDGELIYEMALATAPHSGRIGAAALDFHKRDSNEGILSNVPNILRTPGAAFRSDLSLKDFWEAAAWEMRAFLEKESCPNFSVIPKTAKTPSSRIWLPPALNTKLEGNHFPKNAVAIVGFHRFHIAKDEDPLCPIGNRRSNGAQSEKIVKVFQSTGQQLTYFTLHDMIIRHETLCCILESTTFLKGLNLSVIVVHDGREEQQANVSKFLEILHLLYCNEDQELLITWIWPVALNS